MLTTVRGNSHLVRAVPVNFTDREGLQLDICADPGEAASNVYCIERKRNSTVDIGVGAQTMWLNGPEGSVPRTYWMAFFQQTTRSGSGSSGGVGGTAPDCPPVPGHPAGADITANIKAASGYAAGIRNQFNDSPSIARYTGTVQKLSWLYDHAKNKGPYDYKQDKTGNFEDFGNFNFGAVGAALGLGLDTLLRGAGFAQVSAGTSRREWGTWHGGSPYGDDPHDQEEIRKGFEYYQAVLRGCK